MNNKATLAEYNQAQVLLWLAQSAQIMSSVAAQGDAEEVVNSIFKRMKEILDAGSSDD